MGMIVQTVERIRAVLLARLVGSPGLTEVDTSPGSDLWLLCNAFAHEARKLVVGIVSQSLNCIPATASGIWLDRWAATLLLSGRAVATAWVGTITLQAETGETPTLPNASEIVHADGTRYQTTAPVAPADWVAGYVTVAAIAITLGAVANKTIGTSLSLVSPPVGCKSSCVLASTTTEGTDRETDDSLRARILIETSGRPGSGRAADYVAWALEWAAANGIDSVVDACVYPRWSAVDPNEDVCIAPLGPSGARIVTDAPTCVSLQTYLRDRAPIGAEPTVAGSGGIYGTVTGTVSQIVCTVRPRPGYGADWVSPAPAFTVGGFDAPLLKITLGAGEDCTGIIAVGDRVLIVSAVGPTGQYTYELVVTEVDPAAGNYITVATWPFEAGSFPLIGSNILPGGPLYQPSVDALQAHFGSLGTQPSAAAGKPRYPANADRLPGWLYLSDLYRAVELVPGVESVLFATPATDLLANISPGATPVIYTMTTHPVVYFEDI